MISTYLKARHSPSTRRVYFRYWKQWDLWCSQHRLTPLPATPDAIARYVSERAEDAQDSTSTIHCRLAAIASMHTEAGHESPTNDVIVRRMVQGVARMRAGERPAQVAGLTADVLNRIEHVANLTHKRDRENVALCWTMRDAMLRRSEAVAIRWEDIEKDTDGSGTLLIRRSKTDQAGNGHVSYLSRHTMAALNRLKPDAHEEYVFPWSARTVERRIQEMALRAGVQGRFRGHSPRVGMALDLADNGASIVEMQQCGRWKSPSMPAHYARSALAKRSAVAKLYGDGR